MLLPEECKMPEISINCKVMPRYFFARLIGENIGIKEEAYRAVFIRLTDKALYEYNMARNAVLAQIEKKDIFHPSTLFIDGTPIYAIVISNHLETCINATKRAVDVLTRIKCHPKFPVFINRVHQKRIEKYYKNIKLMRHKLEHVDEEILKDKIKNGQPFFLITNKDASEAEIGDKKLNLISLAMVISQLHEIALELASYKIPGIDHWN